MAVRAREHIEMELAQAREELERAQHRVAALRREIPAEPVSDYTFTGPGGAPVRLSELFGDTRDLIMIHNMGRSCRYCTLWADGFNGVLQHLESRAGFVVESPDDPEAQRQFAESRGWRFRMCSSQGTTFRREMGMETDEGMVPGVSIFHRAEDSMITRVTHDEFGPGDNYCLVWHLFDLLPGGSGDWAPQFVYSPRA